MTPVTFTSTIRRWTSPGISAKGPEASTPALLTSTSRAPSPQNPVSAARHWSASRTSSRPCTAAARPPAASATASASTSNMPTRQPRDRNSSAVARPMPRAAPLMKTEPGPRVVIMGVTLTGTASQDPVVVGLGGLAEHRPAQLAGVGTHLVHHGDEVVLHDLPAGQPADRDLLVVLGGQPGRHLEGCAQQRAVEGLVLVDLVERGGQRHGEAPLLEGHRGQPQ